MVADFPDAEAAQRVAVLGPRLVPVLQAAGAGVGRHHGVHPLAEGVVLVLEGRMSPRGIVHLRHQAVRLAGHLPAVAVLVGLGRVGRLISRAWVQVVESVSPAVGLLHFRDYFTAKLNG